VSDAKFLWGPNATDQDVAIGLDEARTPDFGFHQPYDARHLPPSDAPDPTKCPTCDDAKKKKEEEKKKDEKDWKDWGYRSQCPASGPPVNDGGDGTSMSAPPKMTPQEAFDSYNRIAESHDLTQEQLNNLGEAMSKTMNQSQEQLDAVNRWNEMDRQMREIETELP
jgi:hypothetical protein